MRIRSIKPEFWRSSDISSLPKEDRLLFIGLWSYVDDNGVGRDRVSLIAADLFADDLEADAGETFASVHRGLDECSNRGLIVRYEVEGQAYLEITGWRHQKIDRPSAARYPTYDPNPTKPAVTRGNGETLPEFDEGSRVTIEGSSPGTGEQGNRGTEEQGTTPPSGEQPRKRGTTLPAGWMPDAELIQQMRDECPGVDLRSEHLKFTDYWNAKSGRDAVKRDWRGTWRNWVRRAAETPGPRLVPHPSSRRQQETDDQFARALARAEEADAAEAERKAL